jgi:hypothetical protein
MGGIHVTAFVVSLSLVSAGPSLAQFRYSEHLTWGVGFQGGVLLHEAGRHRLFEVRNELGLIVYFSNGDADLLLPSESFRVGTQVQIFSAANGEIPVAMEWDLAIRRPPSDTALAGTPDVVTNLGINDEIRLGPREGFSWTLRVRPVDGLFDVGEYEVRVSIAAALGGVLTADRAQWTVDAIRDNRWRFLVQPPRTSQETVMMYRQRARAALNEGRLNDAIPYFTSAVAAVPGDPLSWVDLGNTYLRLNRYRDAIAAYEGYEKLSTPAQLCSSGSAHFPLMLAYVAVGDEANAIRVLWLCGRSETVATQLQSLRELVRRRAAR